ncbi:MAG: Fe-S cluster assembly protein SufD, partial [Candidatus Binatia bacterium]
MSTSKGNEKFLGAFERRFPNGKGASWLAKLRRSAIDKFSELGLPTTRHEDWKYTNV